MKAKTHAKCKMINTSYSSAPILSFSQSHDMKSYNLLRFDEIQDRFFGCFSDLCYGSYFLFLQFDHKDW